MSDAESRQLDADWDTAHEGCMVTMTAMEYENMQNDIYWAKQDKIDSIADARGAKTTKAEARRKLSRKLYRKMVGLTSNQDIIDEVNRQSKHGKITRSTFYRHIEGLYTPR